MSMSRLPGKQLLRPGGVRDVAAFLRTVAAAPQSALLLDYDGTLAPFRERRDRAVPYPGIAPLLQEIMRGGHTRLVIVTGRDAEDVLPLLAVYPPPEVCGLHGLQRLKPNGATEMACLDEKVVQALMDADRWLADQGLRDAAEFKSGSIAVHWRGRPSNEAEELRRRVLLGWEPVAQRSGADLLEFDGGIEIRTPEPDKGDAVRVVLSEMDPHAPAAYLGDDLTDERGFAALENRGLSVLVRPELRPTSADLWLRPPDDLLDFLGLWLQASNSGPDLEAQGTSNVLNR